MKFFACANPSRSIPRPQWLHATHQRRLSHSLLQATFPGDVHPLAPSRREIIDFYPANFYEKASKIHIHLRTHKDSKVHEMSLQTALSKFAKPGHLFLPILQPRKLIGKEAQQYHFKPIDISKFKYHIRAKKIKSQTIDLFPNRDDLSAFEATMVEVWFLMKKGIQVQMQVHSQGPKDVESFQKMCKRNLYLRPDVILAAMPTKSGIVIDPQTNHKIVCWVMSGPVKHPERLEMVKPFSRSGEYYKRRYEVVRAAMDLGSYDYQGEHKNLNDAQQKEGKVRKTSAKLRAKRYKGEEQLVDGISSELDFDDIQSKEQENPETAAGFDVNEMWGIQQENPGISFSIEFDEVPGQDEENTGIRSELNSDEFWDEERGIEGIFPELEAEGLQGNEPKRADLGFEENAPTKPATLSLEEQEWEEYKELEVLTGMRAPPG
ncbi:hypothetical protein N431DRAFT_428087 [Stipitochalara longipes BDJ]|nr:hypothetical protein N431DRAFT_428087 [Stipitochalara longipes BDJ]